MFYISTIHKHFMTLKMKSCENTLSCNFVSYDQVRETDAPTLANESAFWAGRVEYWPGQVKYNKHLFLGKCSRNLVSHTVMIKSGHNFAHAMAAELPWHVQNYDLIW